MNKGLIKRKFIYLAVLLIASVCFFTTFGGYYKASAEAYSNKSYQSQFKSVTKKGVYGLFDKNPDDDNYDIVNYLSRYAGAATVGLSFGSGDGEVYFNNNTASEANERNGHFYIFVEIPENLRTAVKNGAAEFSASAKLKSAKVYGAFGIDKGDKVDFAYFDLVAGHRTGSNPNYDNAGKDKNFDYKETFFAANNRATVSEYTEFKVTVGKDELASLDYSVLMLHAHSVLNNGTLNSNVLYMTAPKFEVVSGDSTAPEIGFDISDAGWSNREKTLTVNVCDGESGIQKVIFGGTELTAKEISNDTKNAVYEIPVTANGSYSFTAVDNVGNTRTYTYTESKLDFAAPEISIEIAKIFHSKEGVFFTAETIGTAEAPQCAYWTIDGSEPTESSEVLSDYNEFSVSEIGNYILRVLAVDEAGGSTPYSLPFRVDDTVYVLSSESVHGSAEINRNSGMYGERAKVTLTPDEGYELYSAKINGEDAEVADGVIEFEITSDAAVNVIFRKRVYLSVEKNSFEYADGVIQLPYVTNAEDAAVFDISLVKDGLPALSVYDLGVYEVSYSVDTEAYVGEGKFEISVLPKEIFVNGVTENYVYNEEFSFVYELSEKCEFIRAVFFRDGKETEPSVYGEYEYEFVSDSDNYTVNKKGVLFVAKRTVVITVTAEKVFDNQPHDVTVVLSEDAEYTLELTFNGEKVDNTFAAGVYGFTVKVVENDRFEGEAVGSLIVERRSIKVVAEDKSSDYGDPFETLTYYAENLCGEELVFEPVCDYENTVGTYTISISERDSDNYVIEYVSGTYTVNKKKVYVLPDEGQFKYYGEEDGVLTYTIIGLADNCPSGELIREKGDDAGIYSIYDATFESDCYDFEVVEAFFTVLPKQIVIKTESAKKIYGEKDPEEYGYRLLFGSLEEGDCVIVAREKGEDAGEYHVNDVSVYNSEGEDKTSNYLIIPIVGKFEITKKSVTVIPTGFDKVYGDPDGNITYSVSGLLNGDSFSGKLSREQGENVGSYYVTLGTLDNPNYEIAVEKALCNITVRTVTVKAIGGSKVYGEADTDLKFTTEGMVFGDAFSGSLIRESGEDAGEYLISVGSLHNKNYVIQFVSAVYNVVPLEIEIKISDAEKTFGESDPEFGFTVVGEKTKNLPTVVLAREEGEAVGEYVISATCGKNYILKAEEGTFTINKGRIDLALEDKTVVYNGEAQKVFCELEKEFEIRYEYFLFGEPVDVPVNAGIYTVKAVFDGNESYEYSEATATLTVEKKLVGIVIDISPVKYTGEAVLPAYSLEEDVSVIIEFEDGKAVERGEYKYTIKMEDGNRYLKISGVLTIV